LKHAKLKLETRKLKDLYPHPRNPRTHPEPGTPEWDALKKSLEHDYFDPIVVNDRNGMLVSGHLRVKVLLDMGYDKADCSIVDYDDETHLARMLQANRLVGEFVMPDVKDILEELDTGQFDLDLTGYLESDIEELMTQFHVEEARSAKEDDIEGAYRVIVDCEGEDEQLRLLKRFEKEGLKCRALIV